ncbi:MAG: hypothetical protein IKY02_03610 [Lachnospiraceae bacterium]|nr:hypothetical protein [Lachnospiraceae bacterium]MBR5739055.1 hypothetical protein [Lachnospiraceae bacterium]
MTVQNKPLRTIGHRGYLKKKKTTLLIRSLILAVGAAALILTGYFTTGSVKNWLTIVGLVTAIPFAMQLATLLSMIRYRERPDEEYERVLAIVGDDVFDTELLVANKDGASFYFPYVLFHDSGIYAYLENPKADPAKTSDYIRNYLRLHEVDSELIIYQNPEAFLGRIRSLSRIPRESASEELLKREGVFRAISM